MIAIIKYNAGNTKSVENALKKLGYPCIITDNHEQIKTADKVIFPGVGEASSAMEYLKIKGLDKLILSLNQPFLGICLGLQLMCAKSDEGNTKGLGIFNTDVKKFPVGEKIPHMGWNNLSEIRSELFQNINDIDDVYFVHSYFAELAQETIAKCDYILPFSAAMKKNNFYAVQFHPEKSGNIGEQILKNFLAL